MINMLPNPNIPQAQTEDPLRYTFVEMLFALAVSQVAMGASDLIGAPNSWLEKFPGLAHLTLSLIVIAASWVGWRHSQSPGMKQQILSIFSVRFVGLLTDVLLVILYFILVKSVELEQVAGNTKVSAPTAAPEAFWLIVIFATYATWDLIADVLSAGCVPQLPLIARLWKGVRIAVVCSSASVICLLLSYTIYRFAGSIASGLEVAALDGALLTIVLLFRVLKAIEPPLSKHARVANCKAFSPPRQTQGNELRLGIMLLALYAMLLFLGTKTPAASP